MDSKEGKDISQWDNSYRLGLPEIDAQHKKLLELTALLHASILDGVDRNSLCELLHELRAYSELHFSTEEKLFADHPESSFHRQIHQAFVQKLNRFENDFQNWQEHLAEDILQFLRQWLTTHILETDKRFLHTTERTSTPA